MREIWKDIKCYENLYQVSNLGRVRSLDHYGSNGVSMILYRGKILKPWFDGRGNYLQVTLSKDNKHKKHQVHRLVAETFLPNIENKREVNHKNAIKTDNRLDNLEWVTSKENKEHAKAMGLYPKTRRYKNG